MPGTETMLSKPVEKQHTDTVVNFLIRIACQVILSVSFIHIVAFCGTVEGATTILTQLVVKVGHTDDCGISVLHYILYLQHHRKCYISGNFILN